MSSNAPYGYDPMTGKPRTAPAGSTSGQSAAESSTDAGNHSGQSAAGSDAGAGNRHSQSAGSTGSAGRSAAPYGYDPMTGKPRTAPAGSKSGQRAGGAGAGNSSGQSAGSAGRSAAPYGYDPMTGKPRTAPAGSKSGQSTVESDSSQSTAESEYIQSLLGPDDDTADAHGTQPNYGQPDRSMEQGAAKNAGRGGRRGRSIGGGRGGFSGRRAGIYACIIAIILAVCVLANAAVSLVTGGSSGRKGDGVFPTEVQNTLDAIADRDEAAAFVQSLSETNKTVGMTLSASDLTSLLTSLGMDSSTASLLGISGSIETAVSNADQKMSCSAEVTIAGQSCTLNFYFDMDELVISAPGVLESTYQIDLDNVRSDLEASIFYPSSGSDYALSESDYNEILDLISQYEETAEKMDKGAVIVSDLEYFVDQLEDEGLMPKFDTSSADVTVGGETVSCKAHTAEISAQDAAAILVYTQQYITDTYGENIVEMLDDAGFDISDLSELAQEMEENGITVTVEYDVKGSYMVRLDLKMANSEGSMEAVIDFGTDPANSSEIVMDIYSNGESAAELTLEMESDSAGSSFALNYAESSGAAGYTVASYSRSSADGTFSLNILGMIGASGTAAVEDDTMTVSGLTVTYSLYFLDLSDFLLTLTTDAEISKPDGDAVNLLKLSQDELSAAMSEAYSSIQTMYTGMMSAFY